MIEKKNGKATVRILETSTVRIFKQVTVRLFQPKVAYGFWESFTVRILEVQVIVRFLEAVYGFPAPYGSWKQCTDSLNLTDSTGCAAYGFCKINVRILNEDAVYGF